MFLYHSIPCRWRRYPSPLIWVGPLFLWWGIMCGAKEFMQFLSQSRKLRRYTASWRTQMPGRRWWWTYLLWSTTFSCLASESVRKLDICLAFLIAVLTAVRVSCSGEKSEGVTHWWPCPLRDSFVSCNNSACTARSSAKICFWSLTATPTSPRTEIFTASRRRED